MKKCVLTILASLLCLFLFALDITSTESGGDRNWSNLATWIGSTIPSAGDNVFINGLVVVNGPKFCNNMTVNASGVVQTSGVSYSVTINGSLENHGVMQNKPNSGTLTVNLAGNLANYGTLKNSYFYLINPGQISLWMDAAAPAISCLYFYSQSDTGTYQAASDLRFSGANVKLNNRSLVLYQAAQDFGLYFDGGALTTGTIEGGNASFLNMENNASISNLMMDDIIWQGIIRVGTGVFVDNLINQATVENTGNSYSLTINERLENHGIIRNKPSGGYLLIYLLGDLANYGTLKNSYIYLTNPGLINLWMDAAAPAISCLWFYSQTTTGSYQALSDLRFVGTQVKLNNRSLVLHEADQSFGLYLDGGYLTAGTLEGGNASFLNMENNASISFLSMDDIIWQGIIQVGTGVFVDNLINQATVENTGVSYNLTINERLENHGTIRNKPSGGYLLIYLAGDLANYGTLSNSYIYFTNTGQITLWQDADAPAISCPLFQSQTNTGTYQALSDLRFSGAHVDLHNRPLLLYNGRSNYGITMSGGYLHNVVIDTAGFSFLDFSNDAYLSNVQAEDIILRGEISIDLSCSFDDLVNRGTMMSTTGTTKSVTCSGNVVNYGTVKNNPSGTYLYLYCGKDLSNYGTIQNHSVHINGTLDQYILNTGTISVNSFKLVSEIGPNAAWYFNDSLQGNGTEFAINVADQGVWQPRNGTVLGRLITIGNGVAALAAPQNLSSYLSGSELKLQWNQVPGATYYNVYYSDLPEGPFTTLLSQVFDNDLSDGFVQADLSGIEPRRFYQVKAGN